MQLLYRLNSNSYFPIHTTGQWREEAIGIVMCPQCSSVDLSRFPEPIDIVLNDYPTGIVGGGVFFTGVSIFHTNLIRQMQDVLPQSEFALGRCLDADGRLIEEFLTCYSRAFIVRRGQVGSRYKVCTGCGAIETIARMPHYIPRFYLSHLHVYMDRVCRMYLSDTLVRSLDFSQWPDVDLKAVPIQDDVVDGQHLPLDP
jgi:hypothetical protein